MNVVNIKDYVTLFISDIVQGVDNTVFTWSIPVSYYSNQRSRVCSVSVTSASISTADDVNSICIDYLNGGYNTYSSSKLRHVVSHLSLSNDAGGVDFTYVTLLSEPIQLLTNARPDKIQLRLLKTDNIPLSYAEVLASGCITLAFTYYDAEETNAKLHNQYTNVLR